MKPQYINGIMAMVCFLGIAFVQSTQLQIILATGSIVNIVSYDIKNAVEVIIATRKYEIKKE